MINMVRLGQYTDITNILYYPSYNERELNPACKGGSLPCIFKLFLDVD
jgi:hypothetical protein